MNYYFVLLFFYEYFTVCYNKCQSLLENTLKSMDYKKCLALLALGKTTYMLSRHVNLIFVCSPSNKKILPFIRKYDVMCKCSVCGSRPGNFR